MNYITNTQGNLELHFSSPVSRDNGFTNEYLGMFDCTMELFKDDNGTPTMIEWIAEDKDDDIQEVEHIGLCFDGKELIDYDGLFELPIQAIKLIRKSGYKVSKDFE